MSDDSRGRLERRSRSPTPKQSTPTTDMDGGALVTSGSELGESELLNVCVSGGSSGIGRQIVQSLCAIGHRVLFTYYSNESSARELEKSYPTATAVYCDQGELSRCLIHQTHQQQLMFYTAVCSVFALCMRVRCCG